MKCFLLGGAAATLSAPLLLGGPPSAPSEGKKVSSHFQKQLEDPLHRTKFGTQFGGAGQHQFFGTLERHLITLPPGLKPRGDWSLSLYALAKPQKGSAPASPRIGWRSWGLAWPVGPLSASGMDRRRRTWEEESRLMLQRAFPITPFLKSAAARLRRDPRQVVRGSQGPLKMEARAITFTKPECFSCHKGEGLGSAAGILLWESGKPKVMASHATLSIGEGPPTSKPKSAPTQAPSWPLKVSPASAGSSVGSQLHRLAQKQTGDLASLRKFDPTYSAALVRIPYRHVHSPEAASKVPGVWRLDSFHWVGPELTDGRPRPGLKYVVSELLPRGASPSDLNALSRGMAAVSAEAEKRFKKGDFKVISAQAGPVLIEARPLIAPSRECLSCHSFDKGSPYGYTLTRVNSKMTQRWRRQNPYSAGRS